MLPLYASGDACLHLQLDMGFSSVAAALYLDMMLDEAECSFMASRHQHIKFAAFAVYFPPSWGIRVCRDYNQSMLGILLSAFCLCVELYATHCGSALPQLQADFDRAQYWTACTVSCFQSFA